MEAFKDNWAAEIAELCEAGKEEIAGSETGTSADTGGTIIVGEEDACPLEVTKSKGYEDALYFYIEEKNKWELAKAEQKVKTAARAFDECAEENPTDSNV